mmetsp:Transcript_23041/g.54387  ORF Transcript_23041/g.54387 Transcript_23041/m.54387 type:complete len:210 (+) Transcript_23041:1031-1660(+)
MARLGPAAAPSILGMRIPDLEQAQPVPTAVQDVENVDERVCMVGDKAGSANVLLASRLVGPCRNRHEELRIPGRADRCPKDVGVKFLFFELDGFAWPAGEDRQRFLGLASSNRLVGATGFREALFDDACPELTFPRGAIRQLRVRPQTSADAWQAVVDNDIPPAATKPESHQVGPSSTELTLIGEQPLHQPSTLKLGHGSQRREEPAVS